MKRGGHDLVEIETGYEKAISRSKLAVERNTNLLQVTVPIGVVRSLTGLRPLSPRRSARGSTGTLAATRFAPAIAPAIMTDKPRRTLRRLEIALVAAIACVSAVSFAVALI